MGKHLTYFPLATSYLSSVILESPRIPRADKLCLGKVRHNWSILIEVALMPVRNLLLLLVLLVPVVQSCASTYAERITSDPPNANIYWGYSQSNFVDTDYVTPFEGSTSDRALEARCYQVRKEGYYDSEVICRPRESGDRFIHFSLRLKPDEEVSLSMTGTETASTVQREHSQIAEDSEDFLRAAVRRQIPEYHGPAAKYLEAYLKDNGHGCYVEILPSLKYEGKYVILIYRYSSEGEFHKDRFTEAGILAAASLLEKVKWVSSELFFDYSAFFQMDDRNVGWAVISVEDCIEAKNLLLDTNNNDQFGAYWKSKIQYITDSDPEPIL